MHVQPRAPNEKATIVKSLTLLMVLAANAVHAAPFAYVPNEKSGTVSVIDTATDKVVREIAAGKRPRGIAIDPSGQRLYLSDAMAAL
jgi:YVTN family beta-propeller protein